MYKSGAPIISVEGSAGNNNNNNNNARGNESLCNFGHVHTLRHGRVLFGASLLPTTSN